MRKRIVLGLALSLLTSGFLFAQPNLFQSFPSGLTKTEELKSLPVTLVQAPTQTLVNDIISGNHPQAGDMYIIGYNQPVAISPETHGIWQRDQDFTTWKVRIKSEGAEGLALLFSRFRIPGTASVFVYSPDGSHKSRAYTGNENPGGAHFSTEVIIGDEIILEYWAPAGETQNPELQIEGVSYVFREGQTFAPKNAADNGSSANCHVNVNCPEGSNWSDQRRGVAKIYVIDGNMGGLCTGSLINNTAQDCRNFFLTAQHCGAGASASNFNQWQFYFNFESSNCSNLSNAQANNVDNQVQIGCTRRAASADNSNINGSDFLLVEFNTAIPTSFNVFYNGWDRNNTAASSGSSVHHPNGDIKKISTFSSTLQNSNWTGTPAGSHWRVVWASTTSGHGVTEPGSSGSPIFNQNRRIVGDLSGGSSYCNSVQPGGQTQPDYYGKFSYSWQSNGSTNNRRLSPWLDPGNTGSTTLNGRNDCSSTPPPAGGCDTVSNFQIGVHTPSQLTVPPGGWLAGSNNYGDLAKAELFTASQFPANFELTGFILYFHTATGSGNVTIKVWNANGPGGAPGTVLSQGTVAISSIPTGGSGLLLNLQTPIPITGNFFIGFDVPQTSGTSVALFTTAVDEVSTNTGWEQFSDNSWHSYNSTSSYNIRLAHAVMAIGCPNTPAVQTPVANFTGSPTTLPAGNNVNFTQTSTNNPTSFAWTISPTTGISYQNGTSAASANPVVRFNTAGQYTISLMASNSGGSDTHVKTNYITVTSGGTTSLDEFNVNDFTMYPNPVESELHLNWAKTSENPVALEVRNMLGQVLMNKTIAAGATSASLNVSELPSGVYHLLWSSGNLRGAQSFVKH
jgi:PKD repeat protein